jgi:hypothetical protein
VTVPERPKSDLRRMADEAARLADALRRLSGQADEQALPSMDAVALAKQMLRHGHNMANYFDGRLFADPARYVLLDLYVSEAEGRQVATNAACIAAGVPSTTGLRTIVRLEELGLVSRHEDRHDNRRVFVRLTEFGWSQVNAFLIAELKAAAR